MRTRVHVPTCMAWLRFGPYFILHVLEVIIGRYKHALCASIASNNNHLSPSDRKHDSVFYSVSRQQCKKHYPWYPGRDTKPQRGVRVNVGLTPAANLYQQV